MKNIRTLIIALLFALILTSGAFAHELWFDVEPEGEVGSEHVIKLYWGDFGEFADPRSSYFAAIAEGELWVLTPDGQRLDLELTELPDRYEARFIPETGGDHQVIFQHNRGVLDWQHGEPQGPQTIENITKAFIDVEADEEIEAFDQVYGLPFELKALTDWGHLHTGHDVHGQALYQDEPVSDLKLTVYSPNLEVLELTSDQNGEFVFTPDTEGFWLIKTAHFDDTVTETDGQEVVGARYSYTQVVYPHDESETILEAPAANVANTFHYYYALSGLLLAGAGFFFGKSQAVVLAVSRKE